MVPEATPSAGGQGEASLLLSAIFLCEAERRGRTHWGNLVTPTVLSELLESSASGHTVHSRAWSPRWWGPWGLHGQIAFCTVTWLPTDPSHRLLPVKWSAGGGGGDAGATVLPLRLSPPWEHPPWGASSASPSPAPPSTAWLLRQRKQGQGKHEERETVPSHSSTFYSHMRPQNPNLTTKTWPLVFLL